MSLILVIFLVLSIMGMSLYTTDALHKMKDDVRTLKIRTGKLIQLLDAVLSRDCSQATNTSTNTSTNPPNNTNIEKTSEKTNNQDDDGATAPDDNEDSYINSILSRLGMK
jgi:hypothetical protein